MDFTGRECNGQQHAFICDEGHRYDPTLALQFEQLALEVFRWGLAEEDLPVALVAPAESKH